MTAKHEITLRITLTDEELIRKIRSISQPDRGRVIQRALKVYFDTVGGREVYEMLSKEVQGAKSGRREDAPARQGAPDKLKDVLGDF
ncbi:MAG TPA: hypothetical protein PLE04_14905 [Syntrophales bacterium]|jgi:hypothetical protein|nr:hypothetical protein [Syntrophales bacterium]